MVNPIGSRISPLLQAAGSAPVVTPGAPAAAATPAVRAMPENKSAFTHRIKQLISFYDQYFGDELTRMGGRRGKDEIVTGWRYVFVASARALGVPSKVITAMRKPGVTLEDVIDVTFLKPNEQKAVADALVKLHSEQDEKLFGMAIRNCLKRNDLNCLWNMIQFRGSVSEDQAQDLWRQAVVTVITKPEERSREGMTNNADSLAAELFRNKSIRKDIPSALKDPAAAPVATAPGAVSAAAASGASLPTAREIALLKIKTAVLKGDAVLSAPVAQAVSDESQTLKFVKEDEKKLAALKADATSEEKEKLSKALVSTKKDYAEAIVATDKAFEAWLKELQSDFDDLKKKFDEATKPEDKAEAQKAMDAKAAQLAAAKKISPVDYVASMDGWSAADVDSFRTQVQGQYDAAVKAKETAEVVAARDEAIASAVASHKKFGESVLLYGGGYMFDQTYNPEKVGNQSVGDKGGAFYFSAIWDSTWSLGDTFDIKLGTIAAVGKTSPYQSLKPMQYGLGGHPKNNFSGQSDKMMAIYDANVGFTKRLENARLRFGLGLADHDTADHRVVGKGPTVFSEARHQVLGLNTVGWDVQFDYDISSELQFVARSIGGVGINSLMLVGDNTKNGIVARTEEGTSQLQGDLALGLKFSQKTGASWSVTGHVAKGEGEDANYGVFGSLKHTNDVVTPSLVLRYFNMGSMTDMGAHLMLEKNVASIPLTLGASVVKRDSVTTLGVENSGGSIDGSGTIGKYEYPTGLLLRQLNLEAAITKQLKLGANIVWSNVETGDVEMPVSDVSNTIGLLTVKGSF